MRVLLRCHRVDKIISRIVSCFYFVAAGTDAGVGTDVGGVCVALALTVFADKAVRAPGRTELFAFVCAGPRVQWLAYESDTSIDDHDV